MHNHAHNINTIEEIASVNDVLHYIDKLQYSCPEFYKEAESAYINEGILLESRIRSTFEKQGD